MRPIRVRCSVLAAAAVLALPAAARAERFRYRFQPGQVTLTRVSMAGAALLGPTAGTMAKMQFRSLSRQVERVQAASGGVVTLEVTDQPISMETIAAGKTARTRKPPSTSIVRVTDRGRFLSRKSSGSSGEDEADGPPGLDGLDITYGLSFPDRELHPGDRWDGKLTVGGAPHPIQVRATWRYVGHVRFRGRDCIRVNTNVSLVPPEAGTAEPASDAAAGAQDRVTAQDRMTANVVTYFDPARGVEVYSSGSVILLTRADLSAVNPDGGDFASITKINVVQTLFPAGGK